MKQSILTLAALGGLLALLVTSGCYSTITAGEVKGNANPDGMRYFLPAPYLVVTELPENKWDAQLNTAVDRSHEYYVQPQTVFAKGTAEVSFNDDGTLKSFKLTSDATTVADAVVTATKDIELKNLELQQDALDRQIQARQSSGSGSQSAREESAHKPRQAIDISTSTASMAMSSSKTTAQPTSSALFRFLTPGELMGNQ